MKYLITGVVGAGKSSVRRFLETTGYSGIELDDKFLSCWVHKKTGFIGKYSPGMSKDWLDNHAWLVDRDKLINRFNENIGKDFYVSGVPSNVVDIFDLFDGVYLLQISGETIEKRLAERAEIGAFGKSDDELSDIMRWKDGFIEDMLQRGAIPIDAEKSIEDVGRDILKKNRSQG